MFIRTLIIRLFTQFPVLSAKIVVWLDKIYGHLTSTGKRIADTIRNSGATPNTIKELLQPSNWKSGTFVKGLIALETTLLAAEGIDWVQSYFSDEKGNREKFTSELVQLGATNKEVQELLSRWDGLGVIQDVESNGLAVIDDSFDFSQSLTRIKAMENDLIVLGSLLGMSQKNVIRVAKLLTKVQGNVSSYEMLT